MLAEPVVEVSRTLAAPPIAFTQHSNVRNGSKAALSPVALACDHNMRREFAWVSFDHAVAESAEVKAAEQCFAAAEQDGHKETLAASFDR